MSESAVRPESAVRLVAGLREVSARSTHAYLAKLFIANVLDLRHLERLLDERIGLLETLGNACAAV